MEGNAHKMTEKRETRELKLRYRTSNPIARRRAGTAASQPIRLLYILGGFEAFQASRVGHGSRTAILVQLTEICRTQNCYDAN